MRSLIESIINEEISLIIEKKRGRSARRGSGRRGTGRRRSARLTPAQRREKSYRRAFSASTAAQKDIVDFNHYINVTSNGLPSKAYSWTLTRSVWGAKRIAEFAKTFRKKDSLLSETKSLCKDYAKVFRDKMSQACKSDPRAAKDIATRLTYIIKFLEKAKKYAKRYGNGWDEIVDILIAAYSTVVEVGAQQAAKPVNPEPKPEQKPVPKQQKADKPKETKKPAPPKKTPPKSGGGDGKKGFGGFGGGSFGGGGAGGSW